jgi:antiviral helicase SKI2
MKIIDVLKKKNLLPVVCFAFSKKKCEELAFIFGNTDLNEKSEKAKIYQFIDNSMQRLKGISFV